MKFIAITCFLLLTACSIESDELQGDKSNFPIRVDSCDLRIVFGTCVEYTLSELDDWYLKYVESACPKNKRGRFVGKYKKGYPCPSEGRVARCENIIEEPGERYEYDTHYYVDTAEGYSWEATNIQVTCKKVSGRYVPE
jgi:hypothetical protein